MTDALKYSKQKAKQQRILMHKLADSILAKVVAVSQKDDKISLVAQAKCIHCKAGVCRIHTGRNVSALLPPAYAKNIDRLENIVERSRRGEDHILPHFEH